MKCHVVASVVGEESLPPTFWLIMIIPMSSLEVKCVNVSSICDTCVSECKGMLPWCEHVCEARCSERGGVQDSTRVYNHVVFGTTGITGTSQ